MSNKAIIVITCLFGSLLIYSTELSLYESLALTFSLFTFLKLLFTFGHSIVLRELMAFIASLQLLFSSALEFIYQPENILVSSNEYFSYILPAVVSYVIGLFIPIFKNKDHVLLIEGAKNYLVGKQKLGRILLIIGLIGSLTYQSLPIQVRAIVYLFAICLYASVMYGHYLPGKTRNITIAVAFGLLIYTTVREGAFGQLIFWTTLYLIFVLTGTRRGKSLSFKMSIVMVGVAFIVIIQSVKMEYRQNTWGDKITERRADPELLASLIKKQVDDPNYILSKDHLLLVAERFNQGGWVAKTLYYVPRVEPYANGELLLHFLYPVIPRLFWSEKPTTGGIANITRFTPFVHTGLSSFNISPFGEAYANFGTIGGVLFMFFFGLLFNACFAYILRIAESYPTIILWLPCLFSGCLTVETDVLSMWGSFITTAIFMVFLWILLKKLNINL